MPQCLPAIFRGCCLHQIGSVRRLADRKFASAAVAFRGGPSPHTAGRPRRVQPAPPSPAFVDVSSSVRLGDPSWDSAVLLVDKPLGWTSQDVCSKLRGVLKAKKVGHAGTLDPNASGLLIVLVGRATKLADSYQALEKGYSGCLRLGEATASYDADTAVTDRRPWEQVTDADLEAAAAQLTGDILQLAPMYSAVKIRGQKLYEAARKGLEIERQPRPVTVKSFKLRRRAQQPREVMWRITCSKGTYIRSLVHDLGQLCGSCAHVTALRRERIGAYSVSDAWELPQLVETLNQSAAPSAAVASSSGLFG